MRRPDGLDDAEQERLRAGFFGLDPDPLHVDPDDLWDPALGAWVPRPSALWALLVGLVIGAVLGALLTVTVTSAAPRTGSLPSIPVADAGKLGAPRPQPEVARRPTSSPAADREQPTPSGASTPATLPDGSSIRGVASWYATSGPGLYAAAGPPLRTGNWRGRWVVVSANGRSVRLQLTDWCACRGRLIDLSDDAFRRLAPLSRGLVVVTVRRG